MKKIVALLFVLPLALALSWTVSAQAAAQHSRHYKEHAYYGDISDSNCGAHHHMPANARACTLGCVKHGAKYVFVTEGKVFVIENQKLPSLEKFAGEHVRIEGTRSADGKSIAISAIRGAKKRAAKKKA